MWWWRRIKVTQQLLFWKTALFTTLLQCLEGHLLSQFLNNHNEKYKLIIVFSIRPPDALQMWDLKTSGPIGSLFKVIKFEAIMFSKSLHQNTQICHISLKVWLITRFQYHLIPQHEKPGKKWETWQASKKTDRLTLYQARGYLRYLLPTISKVYFRSVFFSWPLSSSWGCRKDAGAYPRMSSQLIAEHCVHCLRVPQQWSEGFSGTSSTTAHLPTFVWTKNPLQRQPSCLCCLWQWQYFIVSNETWDQGTLYTPAVPQKPTLFCREHQIQ